MAKVQIADVIVPSVFADYVTLRTAELSALRTSGIAAGNPLIQTAIAGGGQFANLPFWNDLTGDDEVLSDSGALTPAKITAGQDVAVKLFRGRAFSSNDLAGWVAGDNPMLSIANGVAEYWARKEQAIAINVLSGLFATSGALTATHSLDASTADIGASAILDAAALLGDAAGGLTAIVMHSAKFTKLQKDNLIAYQRNSEAQVQFPTYLGYRVIVDDACPIITGTPNKYVTYLFGAGALAYGTFSLENKEVETDRDSLAGDDILISRRGLVLHPRGVKWASTSANPANSALATAGNWTKVYADKQIRIVRLLTQ